MALNPQYVIAPALQQHFTNKDDGNFLRNGYVLFFKDNARQVGKPVYRLVGSPPNYSYVPYGFLDNDGAWRIDLNTQGAFDYTVYYYPYDDDGNVELYFIQVYSSDVPIIGPPSIFQFSVEAYPNVIGTAGPTGTAIDVNYIPNAQFLLHRDLLAEDPFKINQVRAPITAIAYGGWTFERPNASSATDFVQFQRFGSAITNPDGNPRYAVRISCESPNPGDSFKDIRVRFNNVNKFASADTTKKFTFSFVAETNAGGSLPVSFILYKNYGTGGSTPTETPIQNFTIASTYTQYQVAFSFGDNSSKTLGTLNDDFLQLVIRLPVDSIFDASFTDFILTDGDINMPLFPDTPDSEFKYQGIAGFMPVPAYDGSDVYLPLRLTPTGLEFDRSDIGKIYATSYIQANVGELLCDGAQYETSATSPDGIPYSRLQKVLFDNNKYFPIWGTGNSYVTTLPIDSAQQTIQLTTNKAGGVTAPADGTVATGFTFFNIYTSTVEYYCQGYYLGNNDLYIWNDQEGNANGVNLGTSGFTETVLKGGSDKLRQIIGLGTIVATTLAGKYFTFNTWNSGANQQWYMWFTVDGAGTDPAPGGTGIKVDLKSTYISADVAKIVSSVASGFQIDAITALAGTSVPPGSYWTFNTTTEEYYVWYTVDGAGTDPAPINKLPIKVEILSTDTNIIVAQKTVIAINSKYFAAPDLRGTFLRGWDNGKNIDPVEDRAIRGSTNSIIFGDEIGTFEWDQYQNHSHTFSALQSTPPFGVQNDTNDANTGNQDTENTSREGGSESRPVNTSVNFVIKY